MDLHIHEFVPVDVTWKKYWIDMKLTKERPEPNHVVLACRCGAVQLVEAGLLK